MLMAFVYSMRMTLRGQFRTPLGGMRVKHISLFSTNGLGIVRMQCEAFYKIETPKLFLWGSKVSAIVGSFLFQMENLRTIASGVQPEFPINKRGVEKSNSIPLWHELHSKWLQKVGLSLCSVPIPVVYHILVYLDL